MPTGTHVMTHFADMVLQLEPPLSPTIHHPLPPHHFNPDSPPDCTSPFTHEVHTWLFCIRCMDVNLCQYGMKTIQ